MTVTTLNNIPTGHGAVSDTLPTIRSYRYQTEQGSITVPDAGDVIECIRILASKTNTTITDVNQISVPQ